MKPLLINQRMLMWCYLLPDEENTNKWKKFGSVALVMALIMMTFSVFTASLMYMIKFMAIDLQEVCVGLTQAIAVIPMANTIFMAFYFRHKIPPVFEHLSKFYEKYKDDDSLLFLVQANNKSDWLWKMYFKFMGLYMVILAFSSMLSITFCFLFNGHFDEMHVFHAYGFILPWNQSTILGYVNETIFCALASEFFLVYNGAVLVTFVSICLHHQAFSKMFRHSLRKLDRPNENRDDKKFLCDIIDFHNSAKNWFSETADVYSPHFMIQLICYMFMLTLHIFELDMHMSGNSEISAIIIALMNSSISLSNLFLCCFLGKLASESYEEMADYLYDSNWHDLPVNLQKYFILMIADAQMPLNYHGYGMITLNLDTFSSLIRAVYTYYMMFKTVSE